VDRRRGGDCAGILLALAIDSWWQDRAERIQEHVALQGLEVDFAEASERISRQLQIRDSALIAAEILLGMTGPGASADGADTLAVLLPRLIRQGSFDPPLGTLEALIGSGDLRLLRRDELRAALASFPSALDDHRGTEGFASIVNFDMLLPFLNQRLPMQRYGLRGRGASDFAGDPGGVLRSLEFENLIQNRLMNTEFQIDGLNGLQDHVDLILRLVREELRS
jgi:hypothetical protein